MRRHTLGLALSAILAPSFSYALGLGEISTNSALNQPLDAEIEMVSTDASEVDGVSVKIAPEAVFEQVGISRSPVLDQLQFQPSVENGQPVIKVTSNSPIQEPFVNFIVEVSWPKGKLLREYTVLLDPPVLGGAVATAPVMSAPEPAISPVESVVEPAAPVTEGMPPFLEEPLEVEPLAQAELEPAPIDEIPLAETFPVDSIEPGTAPSEEETYAVSEPLPPFLESGASIATPADGSDTETYTVDTTVADIEGTSEIFVTPPGGVGSYETASTYFDGDSYPVQKGDTLFSIAKQIKPGSANIHQMMVALLQDNPKAFIKGDMNRLKAGYILRVPDEETIAAISRRDAKAQVLAATQAPASAYDKYKETASTSAAAQGEIDSTASVAGLADLDKRVKEAAEAAASAGATVAEGAQKGLEILVPGEGGNAAGGEEAGQAAETSTDVAFLREKLSSAEQENVELRSRVSELETLLEAKNRLIELKDEQLADLQDQLAGGVASTGAVDTETTPPAEEPSKGLLTEEEKETPTTTLTEKAQEAVTETEEAVTETTTKLVDEVKEPGLVENIKSNPNLVIGAGAGALLLSGLAWLAFRRKDEDNEQEVIEEPAPISPEPEGDVEAAITDEEIDTSDVQIERASDDVEAEELDLTAQLSEDDLISADVMPPEESVDDSFEELLGTPEEETNEDEVLSEANVYLAYGLQDQAIDLLKPAVEAHPDRSDYVAKLAEAYHAAGNKDAFIDTAAKLNQQVTPDQQELWHRVAVLGKDMAPDHELFVNADTGGLTMTQIRQKPDGLDIEPEDADGEDGTVSMPAEFTADLNDAVEELSEELPEEPDLPDLDELSKSLQIEEDDAIRALRESADIDLDINSDDVVDATQVAAPLADMDAPEKVDEAIDGLKSEVDDSVAEFDSRTLGLNLSGTEADFSLSEMEEDLTSMTTGADEMSTKLDLAKAYIDMGDDEGAREALDEVISNGSDEQQEAAKKLLGQLG
ncbi:MAG: FimV/HubP family polar landmark protein [Thiotrichales bacterium]